MSTGSCPPTVPRPGGHTSRIRRRVGILGLALLVGFFSPLIAAPWYEYYDNAEKALQARRWDEALTLLRKAIEQKSDSGVRVRTYGVNFTAYFPYLKKGIALYNLGQMDAALEAFAQEEQAGAVAGSASDLAALERYRDLARKESDRRQEEQRRKVVGEALAEARSLADGGRLEEAITALGRAQAVDDENDEVATMLARLQAELKNRKEAEDVERQAGQLAAEGEALLGRGQFGEAAALFRRALSLKQDTRIRGLLEEAQTRLADSLRAVRDEEARKTAITDGLRQAAQRRDTGDLAGALGEIESVLAIDPRNTGALGLQTDLLRRQEREDREDTRQRSLDELIREARDRLSQGAYEATISAANRILAMDPANHPVLPLLVQAQRALRRSMLQQDAGMQSQPRISLQDERTEVRLGPDEIVQASLVGESRAHVSGTVYHQRPVRLTFLDADGRPLDAHVSTYTIGDYHFAQFSADFPVRPGFNPDAVRIRAEDDQEQAAGVGYSVYYSRPFYRAPWFMLVIAAVPVMGGAGFLARRAARRKQLVRRRFNPYIAGAPVLDEDLFFGREALLARILQTIHNNSIMIYGERRIGKTSIQHQLKRRLSRLRDEEYEFYPVYIDLQGTPQERFFETIADEVFTELGPLLNGAHAGGGRAEGEPYTYSTFVRDIHTVLRAIKARSGKKAKLVLLIDEIDALNAYDPYINQRLRSLFMKSFAEDLVAVVSGVGIKKHWDSEGSPWYNFFEEIEVTPVSREDARLLIQRPIRGILQIEGDAVEKIIDLSRCRPYLIQKLCISLVSRMHEERRRRITAADVEAVGRPAESRGA